MSLKGFKCNLCPKSYVTERGYKKHLTIHSGSSKAESSNIPSTTTFASNEEDLIEEGILNQLLADDFHLEDSEPGEHCEEVTYFELEDEEEEELREAQILGNSISEEPATKKRKKGQPKRKPLLSCNICGKSYQTLDGYAKHRVNHATQDLFENAPDMPRLKEECSRLAQDVLEEIKKCNFSVGPSAEVAKDVQNLLEHSTSDFWISFIHLVCEGCFNAIIKENNYLSLSQLRESFIRDTSAFMASKCEREKLLDCLSKILTSPNRIQILTLATFMRRFSKKLLALCLNLMIKRGDEDSFEAIPMTYAKTNQSVDSLEFKQIIHYIGGSSCKSILRTGLRLKNPSSEWKSVIHTIKACFLIEDPGEVSNAKEMAWTAAQSRGKLTVICESALNFFIILARVVKPLEHSDGSLLTDEAMGKVASSSQLIFLWDMLLEQGSLDMKESFKLLHAICTHFCVTWRQGIINRTVELQSQKGVQRHATGGVAFRSIIAR